MAAVPHNLHTAVTGDWPERLRVLLRAALTLTGPHDRDTVLQRIVEGAAAVADARYAALASTRTTRHSSWHWRRSRRARSRQPT